MPEFVSSTLVILLSAILAVLVLLLVFVIGLLRSLGRIERSLHRKEDAESGVETEPSRADVSAGGAFEAFLSEDPARRQLPKSEQFAAYRRWRQEKGLNWSKS